MAESTSKLYIVTHLNDANYMARYIRNRLTLATMYVNGLSPVELVKNYYDWTSPVNPFNSLPTYGSYRAEPNVIRHDSANYRLGFMYRGNLTSTPKGVTTGKCQAYDYLGMERRKDDSVGSTATMTPNASKHYAVPSPIKANGYTTSLQWDSLLNITSAGPISD